MQITTPRTWRRWRNTALAASAMFFPAALCQAVELPRPDAKNVVLVWNDALLQAVRDTQYGPPVAARSLAIVQTCMFDAWSAYDANAIATRPASKLKRPQAEQTVGNKNIAISFAAYACLVDQFPARKGYFKAVMARIGYNPEEASESAATPSGIGTLAAREVLKFRHQDGANQLGNKKPGAYSDYTNYRSPNAPDSVTDVDSWQPLPVPNGRGGFGRQEFTNAHWNKVLPFALKSGDQFRPGPPASLPGSVLLGNRDYLEQAREVLQYSANLTDEQKAIAEYWLDGQTSAYPAGHWFLLAEYVSRRDRHGLDDDIKLFFALGNAALDTSIACWDTKRTYNSVRPITAIRSFYGSNKIRGWGGPGIGEADLAGADWSPYLPTPPFPEYFSGHSAFSAASAEILKRFTGSDVFGMKTVVAAGASRIEPGTPRHDVPLTWATFSEAADQAGLSRRLGGIHFKQGDLVGREVGRKIAGEVWQKAAYHFGASGDQTSVRQSALDLR